MRINFRQGLVSFQRESGIPKYLQASTTAGFISHIVSPTPTIVAMAHGGSDYLVKFDNQVNLAWQITQPVTTYLYWDIDQLTAQLTRGTTILIPISSISAPPSPADDQHWFDLSTNLMKVWSAARGAWKVKIRLFAGHVVGGNTSQIVQFSEGSTVGLTTPSNPAFIMLDTMLQPLRKSSLNGEFLTDEDETRVLSTVGTSGVLVQPVSRVVPVRAGEAIPRMSMVYFSGNDIIRLADSNPGLLPTRPPVGMCIDAVSSGDIGTLVQSGEVTYDQWDFSGYAGQPVYCDSFGQVTRVRPAGLMAYRVGFIKNANTILLMVDSETNPQVYSSGANDLVIYGQTPVSTTDVINGLGERVVTISVPPATAMSNGLMTAAQAMQLSGLGTRVTATEAGIVGLQTTKANVVHTHIIADVTNLQQSLDALTTAVGTKADKVVGAVNGNFARLNASGNLTDAGVSPSSFTLVGHSHNLPDVLGLQVALDQKSFRSHLNSVSEIFTTVTRTGSSDVGSGATLQNLLDGKSNTGHVHSISEVTNLQTALNGKAAIGHVHTISDVTALQLELDNRAFVSHTHTPSAITGGTVGQVLTSNGTRGTWATPASGGGGGVTVPVNQVAYGTGTGITSNQYFTYDNSLNAFYVNVPGVDNEGGEVIIRSARNSSGFGASEILLSTAPSANRASDVYITGGRNTGSNDGGVVNIYGGRSQDGTGGTLNMGGGNGGSAGGEVYVGGGTGADTGGSVYISAGSTSTPTGDYGGNVSIEAGNGGDYGGDVEIKGGSGGSSSPGRGGKIRLKAGDGGFAPAVFQSGGDLELIAGNSSDNQPALDGMVKLGTGTGSLVLKQQAWEVNGSFGQPGNVLTSGGTSGAVAWAPSGGGSPSLPSTTITFPPSA